MANVPISAFTVPANSVGIGASGYSLTGSASASFVDLSGTWNTSGTPTAIKLNITDTASNASSLLMDLQTTVSGVTTSKAKLLKNGQFFSIYPSWMNTSGAATGYSQTSGDGVIQFYASSGGPAVSLAFGNNDVVLSRRGTANLRFGAADAAAPVAQTLSVQSVVAGTTNTAGANLTITGSQGTGTGAGGSIIFQVAPAGSSGTAQNALATAMTINADLSTSFGQSSAGLSLSLAGGVAITNAARSIFLNGFNSATRINAANFQIQSSGVVSFTATDNAGTSADTILSREAAGVTGVRGANTTTGGAIGFIEQTAPAAPAANGVRIYAEDNGAGKTRLMALFATGAAQQIAIEP